MKKILLFTFLLLSTFYFLLSTTSIVRAGELEDVEKKLSDLKHALQLSIAATTPLEQNLSKLEKNLAEIRSKIEIIEKDVAQKEQQVKEGEKLLILAEELLGEKVKKIYKASTQFTASGVLFLLNNNLNNSLKLFGYQKAIISSDRDTIVKLVLYVKDLEQKKKDLENEKSRLAKIKEETDVQSAFLNKEISGAKKYQAAVSTQIAQLSARQQEILAQKLAGLNLPTSLGAGPLYCTDDRKLDPGFRPAFAFFHFRHPAPGGHESIWSIWSGQSRTKLQRYFTSLF